MLVQNGDGHGLPVAYCYMKSGCKDSLDYMYKQFSVNNDVTKTTCVMVDKDMDNIDVLQQYFTSSAILLCTFHVLKYLKNVNCKNAFKSCE